MTVDDRSFVGAARQAVDIRGLTKRFKAKPPTIAVDDVDLSVNPGEFIVLLGPSGCGKTTMLRCLAGLEHPDAGSIHVGTTPVFDSSKGLNVAPEKRRIGMVFQSYALWPHMTVRKNIGYPLKVTRNRAAIRDGWVEAAAALVECEDLLDRYPSQLSGGQQQRIALARGLVGRPGLMLMDEPLSNLDERLRDQVRGELHELQRDLGFTAVLVTHDQREALALADRLAVMRAGSIEQFDTPDAVFETPASEYVARFIGLSNRLEVRRSDGRWVAGGRPVVGDLPNISGSSLAVRARPEDVSVRPPDQAVDDGQFSVIAEVTDVTSVGRTVEVTASLDGSRLRAVLSSQTHADWLRSLKPRDQVQLVLNWSSARFFTDDGLPVALGPRPFARATP